jgi:beta-galactosidase
MIYKSRLPFLVVVLFFATLTNLFGADNSGRTSISLSGSGWSLWRDEKASWADDILYLPQDAKDLSKLPVNAPTGGWQALSTATAKSVSVPGTVEEYLTSSDYPRITDFVGVSWWFRPLEVPANLSGKKIVLRFESVRMRAEVYLDGKLVAYDLVGESPFEADVTAAVKPGKKQVLAVRVTTPGGNFHWQDFNVLNWGKYQTPPGRGFTGIIGRVNLIAVNPVYVSDVYMQNTPQMRKVNAIITVKNLTSAPVKRSVNVTIVEKNNPQKQLVQKVSGTVSLKPGDNQVTVAIDAPNAKLWDLKTPNLYISQVALQEGTAVRDREDKVFGFRWFAQEDVGKNAVFRLNGNRIVLRTAISWGYWPVTGLIATPDMARKQVLTAKQLGLNMLSFHRSIGSPVVLEVADELGLLYYEEPGSFQVVDKDPFIHDIIQEKIIRMARRDRSHPSLVIYNMINEYGGKYNKDTVLLAKRFNDMRGVHDADPSRTVTFTSGWASRKDVEDVSKAHFRPFDNRLYKTGWYDNHRAGGPETWKESFYKSPSDNLMFTDNNTEIFMRGEEGALSTPPALGNINEALKDGANPGWDGRFWQKQYQAFDKMLDTKGLKPYFPSVDFLTQKLGDISFEHQGRRIQGMRMQNLGDCYAINGWESMPYDNHSGVVDIYRNPKGNPAVLAYYNQPLYIAVAPRQQVVRLPAEVGVDFYTVNELNLAGTHTLRIVVEAPGGKEVFKEERKVELAGGETYGQLLVENLKVSLPDIPGMFTVRASLLDGNDKERATGNDRMLGVDWSPESLKGNGAIYQYGANGNVDAFYKKATGRDLPAFDSKLGKLDWIVVTRPPLDAPQTIEPAAFKTFDGKPGITAIFYRDNDIRDVAGKRNDQKIDFTFVEGAQPDASVSANQSFSVIWEGNLIPPASGQYLIGITSEGGVRLTVDKQRVFDDWGNSKSISVQRAVVLEAGKPVEIRLEYRQVKKSGALQLQWSPPGNTAIDPQMLIDRVKNDGTTLVLLEAAESWMNIISKNTNVRFNGSFVVGKDWVGGVHFVREHPLFRDLPVNAGLNWPYQAVVDDGQRRIGLRLEGEEMIVGVYHSHAFDLGTAVGIIPCGKGKIIFSTLDIAVKLNDPSGPAEVARKLFGNYLIYGRK